MSPTFQPTLPGTAEPMLVGREVELVDKIVAACLAHEYDDSEHASTAHYIRTGADAWQFVCFRLQDGLKHHQAVKKLVDRLTAAEVANKDVSTFIKCHLLHELCPAVSDLPVGVLIALLPLCCRDEDVPRFVPGISRYRVNQLVAKIQAQRIAATKVRELVAKLIGNLAKLERAAWEKVVAYFDRTDDCTLLAALRNSLALRRRLRALLDKAEAPAATSN